MATSSSAINLARTSAVKRALSQAERWALQGAPHFVARRCVSQVGTTLVAVLVTHHARVLALDGPNIGGVLLEGIDVNHPTKDLREPAAARVFAFLFRGDGAGETEAWMRPPQLVALIFGRQAQVHVRVPLGDAQGNPLIEVIFGGTLGRGVHDTNQFVIIAVLFVQQ